MILLIDNYDSFSYNLYQLIGGLNPDIRVIRNDELTVDEIRALNPSHIVLSPGPGRPKDAGVCKEVVKQLGGEVPILGVCLGHQAIYETCGGLVSYARELMHGKSSAITIKTDCPLFKGLPDVIEVGRYHSLIAITETLPSDLEVTATAPNGEIMAIAHKHHKIYGVQFHPESILTPQGTVILKNFLGDDMND